MAMTLLRSQTNWTIPLAVQSFSTQHGTDYGPLNAFIFMSAVPVLIVYLLFQRYFVQGALAGAVKGYTRCRRQRPCGQMTARPLPLTSHQSVRLPTS
ncbi:hypothetical protein [Mycetocola sp. 2940]|uniref:hypothetical protein n=1 Tax=Mycetocola sp. 2940 TaxID=3156452 RepID=UPI003392CD0B